MAQECWSIKNSSEVHIQAQNKDRPHIRKFNLQYDQQGLNLSHRLKEQRGGDL